LAKWERDQWIPLPVPLTDPTSPNLTETDVQHFERLIPKLEAGWEKSRAKYRAIYESAQERILSSLIGKTPTASQLDLAIAISILASSDDNSEVGKVLTQSDTVLHWKATLPLQEYQALTNEYIEEIYEQAVEKLQSLEHNKDNLER
jgi:hypothetical protein